MTAGVAETVAPRNGDGANYMPVAIDTLAPSTDLPFDLYLRTDAERPPVLYRERRLAVDQADLSQLVEQAVETLYIRASEHVAYRNYLRETVLADADLPATRRFKILQIANRTILQMAFQSPRTDVLLNVAGQYGRELASVICNESVVLTDLLPLMVHDYQTYTHATNVCTLGLMIANSMGMAFTDGIVEMAIGLLLHDMGKRHIAPALLNQRRPFTPEQRHTYRQHPKWGFLDLCRRPEITREQLMVVYQHHERWDGRGYPVDIARDEIHLWARICAVADTYDILASGRPNRPAVGPDTLWETLNRESGRRFDPAIVTALMEVLGPVHRDSISASEPSSS